MFEPACRGGSKRSLNISNPTPKWPRSPGEMVSAPARAVDTRAHTRTHTRAHPGPRTRGGAPHPSPPPPPRPRSPGRLGAFSFFFSIFHLPSAGFPPPREGKHRSRRDLSGVAGSSRGRREGAPAWLLRPGFSGERSPGPACRRPGPAGREGGPRPSAPAVRGSCAPRAAPGGPGQASAPGPAAGGKKVDSALRAQLRAGELPRHPSRFTWACAASRGAFGGSELLEDGVLRRGARAGLAGVAAG